MTLNIKNSNFKKWNFSKRLIPICDFINSQDLDIICLQECNINMSLKLQNKLSNYLFCNVTSSNPILIKKDKFNILKQKIFYLSKTPNKKSKFLLSIQSRTCSFALLKSKNQKIAIYNTHLDFLFSRIRKKQLSIISQLIKNEKYKIITGDFNMPYNYILKSFGHVNKLNYITSNIDKTIICGIYPKVDHIFTSSNFTKSQSVKVSNIYNHTLLSDHYPIISQISR